MPIVDTPGDGPGKVEEIFGMNKATGAFLCHGLQADRILSLASEAQTMIPVMPITSVSRIIKKDVELLEALATSIVRATTLAKPRTPSNAPPEPSCASRGVS